MKLCKLCNWDAESPAQRHGSRSVNHAHSTLHSRTSEHQLHGWINLQNLFHSVAWHGALKKAASDVKDCEGKSAQIDKFTCCQRYVIQYTFWTVLSTGSHFYHPFNGLLQHITSETHYQCQNAPPLHSSLGHIYR